MRNLMRGIIDFRTRLRPKLLPVFKTLAAKQQEPDCLFVSCSDSRVAPNLFASTNPGELFVIRNVGNMVPCCNNHKINEPKGEGSVGSAIEFSVGVLGVKDIIVCGHSDCGAMKALLQDPKLFEATMPHLRNWIRNGEASVEKLNQSLDHYEFNKLDKKLRAYFDPNLAIHNKLSQINVLQQLEHALTYPTVRDKVQKGELSLNGWWFDIANADVYAFSEAQEKFTLLNDERAMTKLKKLGDVEFKPPLWLESLRQEDLEPEKK